MDETEREIVELKVRLATVEAQLGRVRWWNIAAGISSVFGATLAALTLWGILNLLASGVSGSG